jgi:hypothetical protein
MYSLGQRVRERVKTLVEELEALPDEQGPSAQAIVTWRVCILILALDISEAPLVLCSTTPGQVRSVQILTDRSSSMR